MMRLVFMVCLALMLAVQLAQAATNPNAVAVIIGNKHYSAKNVPQVEYADRDAEAMRRYVVGVLGYDPLNVMSMTDVSLGQMIGLFGNAAIPRGRLARMVGTVAMAADTDVFVYYSGHGFPGLTDHKGYLLPVDADPNIAEGTGYGLDMLIGNLQAMGARSVTVVIDACFSGSVSGASQPLVNTSVLVRGADPVPALPHMTILTAAGPTQLANWDTTDRHGLFTEYFLRAVYGAADDPTVGGPHDGRITAGVVKGYLDRVMSRSAARDLDREQIASLSGDPNILLASFPNDRFPSRPREGEPGAPPAPAPVVVPMPMPVPVPVLPPHGAAPALAEPPPPSVAKPPSLEASRPEVAVPVRPPAVAVAPPPAAALPAVAVIPPIAHRAAPQVFAAPVKPLAPRPVTPRPTPVEAQAAPRPGGVKCLLPDGGERAMSQAQCRSSAGLVLGAE